MVQHAVMDHADFKEVGYLTSDEILTLLRHIYKIT